MPHGGGRDDAIWHIRHVVARDGGKGLGDLFVEKQEIDAT